jgi:hypothetical protein
MISGSLKAAGITSPTHHHTEENKMADKRDVNRKDIYHIRVKGTLDQKWANWFEGFVITSRADGQTLLSGPVVDQAALLGVLGKIHGLGLPLLMVAQTDCPCSSKNCPRRGRCGECLSYHASQRQQPVCFRARTRWDKQCARLTAAR